MRFTVVLIASLISSLGSTSYGQLALPLNMPILVEQEPIDGGANVTLIVTSPRNEFGYPQFMIGLSDLVSAEFRIDRLSIFATSHVRRSEGEVVLPSYREFSSRIDLGFLRPGTYDLTYQLDGYGYDEPPGIGSTSFMVVPEPSTSWSLLLTAALGIWRERRKSHN